MSNASNDPQLFQDFLEFQRLRAQGVLTAPAEGAAPAPQYAESVAPRPRRSRSESRDWLTPLFDVRVLKRLFKPFLGVLNFLGLGISVATTISAALWAEQILLGQKSIYGVIVGACVAALLSGGQWFFLAAFRGEWLGIRWRWLIGYFLCLAPDVLISWIESWRWVVSPLATVATKTLSETARLTILWTVGLITAGLTTASSVLPERFLFGRRK